MFKVLIAEDDDFIRNTNKRALEAERYEVIEAINRQTIIDALENNENINLILLDIVLNKDNGIELINDIKAYTDVPIIIVSSKSDLIDKVLALEMGADDYMCKPVEIKELLSRVKAHIRRYTNMDNSAADESKATEIMFSNWIMDFKSYSVKNKDGEDASLTKDEFDLLYTLAKSPQVVFTRDKLFEILKADDYDVFDRAVDIQIARIRKKLGDDAQNPRIIKTIRKVGYQFIADKKN